MDRSRELTDLIERVLSQLCHSEIMTTRQVSHCSVFKQTLVHNTHLFDGPLSGTTQVSPYQKDKTNLDLLEQDIVSGSGISWAICKSAPRPRLITMPAPHHLALVVGQKWSPVTTLVMPVISALRHHLRDHNSSFRGTVQRKTRRYSSVLPTPLPTDHKNSSFKQSHCAPNITYCACLTRS